MSFFSPKLISKASFFFLAFSVLLLPFFFLSITSEYYEFNKQALLAALCVLGYSLLAIRTIFNKELKLVRTKLDLPVFLLLAVYIVSSIFSVSPATSFLGQPGVFHGGVLSLVLYIALFCLITQLVTGKKADQRRSLFSNLLFTAAFLLSILTILQYFEIYFFPWEFTHQRFWNPTGGERILLVYLLTISPLLIGRILREKGFRKVFPLVGLLMSLMAVFLVSGWGGRLREILPSQYRVLPTEVTLDWQTSWQVANSVLAFRPLLGSGPGTFSADFTRYKPPEFNQKIYWNIRFNRPANEWFEALATVGLFGVLAYAYLWVRIIRLSVDKESRSPITFSLLFFLIASFFSPFTTVTSVLFWTLLALFATKAGLAEEIVLKAEAVITDFKGKGIIRKIPLFKIFAGCLLPAACCFSYLYFLCYYRAEIHYQEATTEFSQNRENAFTQALTAARLNPLNDVYQAGLATASLGVASPLSQQASPSASLLQQFVSQAVIAGNRAVQLNPENVRNWENLAGLYQNLLSLDPNAGEQVVNSFNQAVNLDPMNPVSRTQLAKFFLSGGRTEEAINQLLWAIRLKPDWAQAHYELAAAYKAIGNRDGARGELQTVLTLLPQEVPQRQAIEMELQGLVSETATPSGQP